MYKKSILTIALSASLSLLFSFYAPKQDKDNELTAAEKKAGWKLLFDGKSKAGWRSYQHKESDGWDIEEGAFHCKKDGVQHRADLITNEEYADFEFAFDWKVSKSANSGLVYRANEEHPNAYESGSEYQLIDDNGYTEKLEEWQKTGADYAMHAPSQLVSKPQGEYNHSVIKAKGNHVEHWLNGVKVADFEIGTPEWFTLKEKSKWKDIKGWGQNKQGHICLQDHGGGIWFKNIKIRKL